MKYNSIFFFFILITFSLFSQEICNNNIDDDGDSLIDIFDPDCPCENATYINICRSECQPNLNPSNTTIREQWRTNDTTATYSSPVVGDLDNDGTTEIVMFGTTSLIVDNPRTTSGINIFSGSTGNLIRSFKTPKITYVGPSALAIADMNNDGYAEIFIASSVDGNLDSDQLHLYCYDRFGYLIWKSDQKYGENTPGDERSGSSIGIADFNSDGIPEIYVYNEIFNAQTGVKLIDGGANGIANMGGASSRGATANPVAADVIPNNNNLELVAGYTTYLVTINNTAGTAGNSMSPINSTLGLDGFTGVADIDNDGELDIVVSASGSSVSSLLYVWNPRNNTVIASTNLPNGSGGSTHVGAPFIGDMDGDGNAEIGVCRSFKLLTYKYDNSNTLALFWELSTSDRSGYTKLTMFDFNQDGKEEIIYRDENNLRIINGSTSSPSDIFTIPSFSETGAEGPVIADVDNDGQAEILINSDEEGYGRYRGTLRCYTSNSLPWAPSRKIWNQYNYFNTNINDDLTIPINQQNHGVQFYTSLASCSGATIRPLNNFMAQATIRDSIGCPAIPIELITADSLFLDLESCNPSDTGIEVLSLINAFGCDSFVTITTTYNELDTTIINAGSCNPADTGLVTLSFSSFQGCDSIVNIITSLLRTDSLVAINQSSCMPADTGVFRDTSANIFGCDSITVTTVSFDSITNFIVELTTCNPTDSGTIVQNLVNSAGCDSIVTINTTLLTSNVATLNPLPTQCENSGVFILNQGLPFGGFYEGIGISQDSLFDPLVSGVGTHQIFYIYDNGNGCIDTVSNSIIVEEAMIDSVFATICDGENYVLPDGQITDTTGVFIDTITFIGNCALLQISIVEVETIPIDTLTYTFCEGKPFTLPNDIVVTSAGYYASQTTSINDCDSTVVFELVNDVEICLENCYLTAPTAYSPNHDNLNDFYALISVCPIEFTTFHFSIYNRWGEEVFTSNSINDGWDGKYKGKESPLDLYSFVARYSYIENAEDKIHFGVFTLIR